MSRSFAIVVAADDARGIGKDGALPWRLPGEMAYFKRLTSTAAPGTQNAVLMGRKTFESIPSKFRPLPGRLNIVLSRTPAYEAPGAQVAASLEKAMASLEGRDDVDSVFVIGGGRLYAEALAHPACARVFLTRVSGTFGCDTQLALFEHDFVLVTQDGPHRDHEISYTFETYERHRPEKPE